MQLPIRRSTCPLRFPSFTGSIMMVYRITVLSFLHPALMSDHWLLFSPEHYAEFISERCRRLSPSSDESAPDTRQSRKWRVFFLSSSADNSQTWPLHNEVRLPQGRERWIKTSAERKRVTGASAFSLHGLFLSLVHAISLVLCTISNIPLSQR